MNTLYHLDYFPQYFSLLYSPIPATERFGRYDFEGIVRDVTNETGKPRAEIQRYFVAFFTHYTRIQEWPKILGKFSIFAAQDGLYCWILSAVPGLL